MIEKLKKTIRNIPDFPKPGILFRDITPVLLDGELFRWVIDEMASKYVDQKPDVVAGIESRGFIFGAALAYKLGCGLAIFRKAGKLPWKTVRAEYGLEYGSDAIELHEDAIKVGQKVVLVDDLLATGGTMRAAGDLVKKLGGQVLEYLFLIELTDLEGRKKLTDAPVRVLVQF